MTSERRRDKRFDVPGDYYYVQGDKERKIKCKLKNISATGACISSEVDIKNDEIIFLHVRGTKNVEIKSKAVWKIDNEYGLLFLLDTTKEFDNISYVMNYVV